MGSPALAENFLPEYLRNGKKIIIITGEVNSGKTARVEKVVALLNRLQGRTAGVYSKGVFRKEKKVGYTIVSVESGQSSGFATDTQTDKYTLRQGRYWFDESVFEVYNQKLIEKQNSDYILIDEIGPLELKDKGFHIALKHLLQHHQKKLILIIRSRLIEKVLNKYGLKKEDVEISYVT